MKPEDLQNAGTLTLLEWYVQAAVKSDQAGTSWRKANVQLDTATAIKAELRVRGAEAEQAFLQLLSHENSRVRCWVAAAALDFAPEQGESVLIELAQSSDRSISFDARMTLKFQRGIDVPSPNVPRANTAQVAPQTLPPSNDTSGNVISISVEESNSIGFPPFPPGAGVTKKTLVSVIRSSGLSGIADELYALTADSIRIIARPLTADKIQVGKSKIGGVPDLPRDTEWPRRDGEPMSFIAQITLSEIARFDVTSILPSNGMLYFFYDAMNEPWGFDPHDRGSCRVMYFDNDAMQLARAEFPDDLSIYGRFAPCHVEFASEITIPDLFSGYIEGLRLDDNERDLYGDLHEKLIEARSSEGTGAHRLLGHPDQIQNDMQRECQLASHGIYLGNVDGYNDSRVAELAKGAKDWTLLLQVEGYEVESKSAEYSDMIWGDAGRIYFWIPRASLEVRLFDDVWLILQCG